MNIKFFILLFCLLSLADKTIIYFVLQFTEDPNFPEVIASKIPTIVFAADYLDKLACSLWLAFSSRRQFFMSLQISFLWALFGFFAGLHAILLFVILNYFEQKHLTALKNP